MRVVPIVLPLTLLGPSPPLEGAAAVTQPSAPPTGSIVAVLAPPSTNYTADLTDPEGGTLTFEWSAAPSCGTFVPETPEPKKARWDHGAEHGCPHDTQSHPGTITVVVRDPDGDATTCVYDGSLSGEEPCQSAVPLLTIDDVEVAEGGVAEFTLTLSAPTDQDVSAELRTSPVTACEATAPSPEDVSERNDYDRFNQSAVIPAGDTSVSVSVDTFRDLMDEKRRETFSVEIRSAENATIADGEGRGTITDDDPEVTLSALLDVVDENEGPAKPIVLVGGLDAAQRAPSGKVVRVTVATEDGSATAGSDYRAREKALTIEPPGCGEKGRTELLFPVRVIDDTRVESEIERFFIVLRDPVNATFFGRTNTAAVQISDDD